MNKQIWKYTLRLAKRQEIEIPFGGEILCVQTQNETICIWALVDPEKQKEIRHFEIFSTGQDIYSDMGVERKYIGTGQMQGGGFVYHLFERL